MRSRAEDDGGTARRRGQARGMIERVAVSGIVLPMGVGDRPLGKTFVGRARQQVELQRALDALASGTGGLVLLSGEPGIGKTRLLDETAARAAAAGVRVAWGRCWEAGAAPAYFPFATALGALWRALDDDQRGRLVTPEAAPAAELVPGPAGGVPPPPPGAGPPAPPRFVLFPGVAP